MLNIEKLKLLIGAMAGVSLVACQAEGVPSDAQLKLSPDETSISVLSYRSPDLPCFYDAANYTDFPLIINLSTSNGSPLGNVDVAVHTQLTAHTGSQYPLIDVYRDVNGNGVIDDQDERVSQSEDPLPVVKTGEWTGASSLLLRANLSCGYKAKVHAIAEGVSGFASIEVIEVEQTQNAIPSGQKDNLVMNMSGRFNENR